MPQLTLFSHDISTAPPCFSPLRSTVPHYLAGRPNYARSLILMVKEHLRLSDKIACLISAAAPAGLPWRLLPLSGQWWQWIRSHPCLRPLVPPLPKLGPH